MDSYVNIMDSSSPWMSAKEGLQTGSICHVRSMMWHSQSGQSSGGFIRCPLSIIGGISSTAWISESV